MRPRGGGPACANQAPRYGVSATTVDALRSVAPTARDNVFAGKWSIDMTFSAPAVEPFKVGVVYPFSTNFGGDKACNQDPRAAASAAASL